MRKLLPFLFLLVAVPAMACSRVSTNDQLLQSAPLLSFGTEGPLNLNRFYPYWKPVVFQKQGSISKFYTGFGMGYRLTDHYNLYIEQKAGWTTKPVTEIGFKINFRN